MGTIIRLLMRILDNGVKKDDQYLQDGRIVLKMNKVYGIIGVLGISISVVAMIFAVTSGALAGEDMVAALGFIGLFLILGLILVLYSRNTMVVATLEKITYTGLTGKSKEISWNEVQEVSYNRSSREITIKASHTKIKLHIHLSGIGSLISLMKQTVHISICGQALQQLGIN